MRGGGDLRLFTLRDLQPGAGKHCLDLFGGHTLRFHHRISLMIRPSATILTESVHGAEPKSSPGGLLPGAAPWRPGKEIQMNGSRGYNVRVEGAKYGVSFGSALAIAVSYTTNYSILWAI